MRYVLLYNIFTALSIVMIAIIGKDMPEFLLILMTVTYAIIFFHILAFKNLFSIYKKIFTVYKSDFLYLNLIVLVVWGGTFLIPINFSPVLFIVSFITTILLCSLIATKNYKFINLLQMLLLLLNLVVLYIIDFKHLSLIYIILFIFGTTLTGIAGYLYIKLSHKMVEKYSLKTFELMAIRFWGIWLVSLCYVIQQHVFHTISMEYIKLTILLSIVTLILPLWVLQKAISALGVNKASLTMAFVVATTLVIQSILIPSSISLDYICGFILPLIILFFWRITPVV